MQQYYRNAWIKCQLLVLNLSICQNPSGVVLKSAQLIFSIKFITVIRWLLSIIPLVFDILVRKFLEIIVGRAVFVIKHILLQTLVQFHLTQPKIYNIFPSHRPLSINFYYLTFHIFKS